MVTGSEVCTGSMVLNRLLIITSRRQDIFDTADFVDVMTQVGGQKMLKYADDLLVIIEGMLEDSSSAHKQEVVVRTLGQVVASTGLVVEPYNRFPNLLMILLNMLFTEPEQSVRKEVKHTYLFRW